MNFQSTVMRLSSTHFSRLDDAYLAIDAQQGYCYSLNATAGRVWELADQPVTVEDLCRQLQEEYAVKEEECRREVLALLGSLQQAGLVQITDSSF